MYKIAQIQRLQNLKPEMLGKDTWGEDVLNCLIFLVAEGTLIRKRKTSFLQSVSSTAVIPNS